MQLKCVAIDDEPLALDLIKQYAERFAFLHLIQTFNDAVTGREFLRQHPVDLLFVDINMPDITGLDLVRSLEVKPMVIFTTAYRKFAADSYDLDAIDYVLKPVEFERFSRAVSKAAEYYRYRNGSEKKESDVFFVRSEYQLVKIHYADIAYIESAEDYIKIHISNGRPVMTLMTMKGILDKLPANDFKRIHRSYVIPLSKVKAVVNKKVRLADIELPIGDSYMSQVQEWIKK